MADGDLTTRAAESGQTAWVLRVLAGPNRGASINLGEGEWIVGNGPSADYTFAEPLLAAEHVRIAIGPDGAAIVALAPGVRLKDRELPLNEVATLHSGEPVAIGETMFAVGTRNTDWREAEQLAATAAASAASAGTSDSQATVGPAPAPASQDASPNPRRSRLIIAAAGAGVLLVVLGLIVGATFLFPGAEPKAVESEAHAAALDVIKLLELDDSVTAKQVGSQVVVSGTVPDPGDAKRLSSALAQARVPAVVNVTSPPVLSGKALVDLASTVISGYGIDGKVVATGPGEIEITGYAATNAKVKAALATIRSDVPSLGRIVDKIATPERAKAFLTQALTENLIYTVTVTSKPTSVEASGVLNGAGLTAWSKIADEFGKQFGHRISLLTDFQATAMPAPKGVYIGRKSYVVLDNGKTVRVGDELPGFGRVIEIGRRGVWVDAPWGKVDVPFLKRPNWIVEIGNNE